MIVWWSEVKPQWRRAFNFHWDHTRGGDLTHRFLKVTQDAETEPAPSDLVREGFTPTWVNRRAISVDICICPYPIGRTSHCQSSTTTAFAAQCGVSKVWGRSVVYKRRSAESLSKRSAGSQFKRASNSSSTKSKWATTATYSSFSNSTHGHRFKNPSNPVSRKFKL
jgi:hypothetical protein